MPIIIQNDLKSSLEQLFTSLSSDPSTTAQGLASALSGAFANGLSNLMVLISVSGTIPGTPTSPYPSTPEPPFTGIYDIGTFESNLKSGLEGIMSAPNESSIAADQKATVIASEIDIMFKTASYITIAHLGVVTIAPPPYTILKTELSSSLANIYSDIGPLASVKAQQVAQGIENATNTYISSVLFNMTATTYPGGPLVPGSGIGIGNFA